MEVPTPEEETSEEVLSAEEGQPSPQQQGQPPLQFPLHKASVIPEGIRYEIWLDALTCVSHVIPDSQFGVMAKLLKEQRQKERAQRIEIAHVLPKQLPRPIH